MINKDSDGIKAIRLGEFSDKVHGDGGEWGGIRERRDWVERDRWMVGEIFSRLTNSATIDIVKGEMTNTRPVELAFDEIPGLQMTGMTNRGSVMQGTNNRLADVEISRNIEATFVKRETVLDGPVRREEFLRWRGFRGEEVAKDIDYFRIKGLTILDML